MLYQKTIRKFIALVMVLVFAFSITPQKSIHELVAKHIDPTSCSVHKDLPIEQIEKTELHCTFDFQVATTPFVYYDFSIILQPPLVSQTRNVIFVIAPIAHLAIISDSRGPPTIFC
jgi:hypothetical protein